MSLNVLFFTPHTNISVRFRFVSKTLIPIMFTGSSDTSGNHPIRLAGGPADNAGRVEIYNGGMWGAVGDQGWDMNDATVVCKELGFPEAMEISRHLPADYEQVFRNITLLFKDPFSLVLFAGILCPIFSFEGCQGVNLP